MVAAPSLVQPMGPSPPQRPPSPEPWPGGSYPLCLKTSRCEVAEERPATPSGTLGTPAQRNGAKCHPGRPSTPRRGRGRCQPRQVSSPCFVLGLPDGVGRGSPRQRDTELLYSLQREKCHPPRGWVFFLLLAFPPPFSTQLLMRQFAGARQTQTGTARLLPGGQALGAGKQGNVALLV